MDTSHLSSWAGLMWDEKNATQQRGGITSCWSGSALADRASRPTRAQQTLPVCVNAMYNCLCATGGPRSGSRRVAVCFSRRLHDRISETTFTDDRLETACCPTAPSQKSICSEACVFAQINRNGDFIKMEYNREKLCLSIKLQNYTFHNKLTKSSNSIRLFQGHWLKLYIRYTRIFDIGSFSLYFISFHFISTNQHHKWQYNTLWPSTLWRGW